MDGMKLTYLEGPGRADTQRLLCALGGFELSADVQLGDPAWKELKPTVAPQQLPLFDVKGRTFGQSAAQQRYLARLAGLYPDDIMEAFEVDELVDYVNIECFAPIDKLYGTFATEDLRKAYGAACVAKGGELHKWLTFIDGRLAGREFAVGEKLTFADAAIFAGIQPLRSEFYPGVPGNCLDGFRNIMKHANMMATLPKVKAYYANAEGPDKVFQP
eukprot:Rhum_TRINITY_DN11943_c0_g2::Rhum_TRINITY_DN11943_c0_g2_i1::g.47965::m.47965/K04097/HPGDS; prostaglandin-H2 D-isomerase / glutathione transferase